MKKIKLALALAAAVSLSNSISAQETVAGPAFSNEGDNTVTVNVGVTAYIAAGLTVSASGLNFGDVVIPASSSIEENGVRITCEDVTYIGGGAPSGPNGDSQNLSDANGTAGGATGKGDITIEGEEEYSVTVTVSAQNGTPAPGVEFSPEIDDCNDNLESGLTFLGALDQGGSLALSLLGTLNVSSAATASTNVSTNAIVTVSYR